MEEWLVKYYPLLRVSLTLSLQERKGWRSDESTRLPPMWSGFKSRRRRPGLSLSLVLSLKFREVFLRVLRFSPLLKNQHFQIPILYSTHGHVFSYRTPKCFEGKQIAIYQKISKRYDNYWSLHLRRWTRFSSHREKLSYCYYKYYFSSIIRKISLRTKLVTSAALVTAHPPLPHPTKIFIVPAWDVSVQRQHQQ